MVGAERVIWCGSDVTVLEYTDKIILVGPGNDCVPLELGGAKTNGLKCLTEKDGLRIVNSEGVFFLERVQDFVVKTLRIASIEPAAQLMSAMKFVDQKIPKADEIIRELTKDQLAEGLETLLEVAKLEHWETRAVVVRWCVRKHLLLARLVEGVVDGLLGEEGPLPAAVIPHNARFSHPAARPRLGEHVVRLGRAGYRGIEVIEQGELFRQGDLHGQLRRVERPHRVVPVLGRMVRKTSHRHRGVRRLERK